jgi:hypothetical protein
LKRSSTKITSTSTIPGEIVRRPSLNAIGNKAHLFDTALTAPQIARLLILHRHDFVRECSLMNSRTDCVESALILSSDQPSNHGIRLCSFLVLFLNAKFIHDGRRTVPVYISPEQTAPVVPVNLSEGGLGFRANVGLTENPILSSSTRGQLCVSKHRTLSRRSQPRSV